MSLQTIPNDVNIDGRLTCKTFVPPANCVNDAAIPSTEQIDAAKLQHQQRAFFSQGSATTTTTVTFPLYTALFAGKLVSLVAGNIAACTGTATITVDLKKNNVTVLTAVITLDSANSARVAEAAALNPAAVNYVAGDCFELIVTATAGGGTLGTGFYAEARFNERSQ